MERGDIGAAIIIAVEITVPRLEGLRDVNYISYESVASDKKTTA